MDIEKLLTPYISVDKSKIESHCRRYIVKDYINNIKINKGFYILCRNNFIGINQKEYILYGSCHINKIISSFDKAKNILDTYLISEGYHLLNEEEWRKYQILI